MSFDVNRCATLDVTWTAVYDLMNWNSVVEATRFEILITCPWQVLGLAGRSSKEVDHEHFRGVPNPIAAGG